MGAISKSFVATQKLQGGNKKQSRGIRGQLSIIFTLLLLCPNPVLSASATAEVLSVPLVCFEPRIIQWHITHSEPQRLGQTESLTSENDSFPVMTFTTPVCEIEIVSAELDLLLDSPLDFYDAYESRMLCEPLPPQHRCQGCRDKNKVFYECFHQTMNPSETCKKDYCIKNEVFLKDCYVSNTGQEDCRVVMDPNPETWYAVQYKIRANRSCNPRSQNPTTLFSVWIGCPMCSILDIVVRCVVPDCPGNVEDRAYRPGRFLCVRHPCPRP